MNANTSRHMLEPPRRLLSVVFIASGAAYLLWRSQTLDSQAPLSSAGLFLLECLAYALVLWKGWTLSGLQVRVAQPESDMPRVDVAVRADEASVPVLRKSLLAALAAQGRREVLLLDTQALAEREQLAAELGCRYLTSAQPGWSAVLNSSDAELLALFRAGDAPRHGFLQELTGHFKDAKLAFVQAAVAPRLSDMRRNARGVENLELDPEGAMGNLRQQGRDARGAALMGDSCVLVRRQAVLSAGGWVPGSGLSAAWATSLSLHRAGWRGAFHAELLAFQVTSEVENQALDKALESLQQAWSFWRTSSVLGASGLNLAQRMSYLGATLAAPLGLAWLAGLMLAPALTWSAGRWPLQVPVADWLSLALPLAALTWLHQHELGRGRSAALPALRGRLVLLGAVLGRPLGGPAAGLVLLGAVPAVSLSLAAWRLGSAGTAYPTDMWVALTWSAAALMLLAWAAGPALRKRQGGRDTHRFTVSVAAELVAADGERLKGTVDDLSERGLRFHGALLAEPGLGQVMPGVLHLPDGPLSFDAEVRHVDPASDSVHLPRALGCRITASTQDRLRLETFLYSADLPWQRRVDGPRHHTPLSRFWPQQVPGPQARQLEQQVWQVAQLREHVTADARPALVASGRVGGVPELLISPTELPDGGTWVLDVFGASPQASRGVALHRNPEPNVGQKGFFSYRLQPAAMPSVPEREQPPVDRALLLDDLPKWSADTTSSRRRVEEYALD